MGGRVTNGRSGWWIAAAMAAGLGWAVGTPLSAAHWNLSPVRLYLPPGERVAVVEVRNLDDGPVVIQTLERRWHQAADGRDDYVASDALIVSPPIFELAAGATQVVRVGLRNVAGTEAEIEVEQAYRIFFSEVRGATASSNGVAVALRLAVPVFVAPTRSKLDLTWALEPGATSAVPMVRLRNAGNVHVQVAALKVRSPTTGDDVARIERPGYALAGAEQRFALHEVASASGWEEKMSLVVETDQGPLEAQIEVPPWLRTPSEEPMP